MGWITNTYRRQIYSKGQPVQLKRSLSGQGVTLTGFSGPVSLSAEHLIGENLGDIQVTIMARDLQKAGWPDRPEQTDQLILGGRVFGVRLAVPIYDGAELCAWRILAVGGLRGESYG